MRKIAMWTSTTNECAERQREREREREREERMFSRCDRQKEISINLEFESNQFVVLSEC